MTEYTPTTEEVRYRLILGADPHDLNSAEREELEEFDRWHAEEIRKAKEEAWEEGANTLQDIYGDPLDSNPYRKEQND